MKRISASALAAVLIWLIAFSVCAAILSSAAMVIAGITSTVYADSVAGILEPALCPSGSKAEIVTHQTIIHDGTRDYPATAYEMQCVKASGEIVRAPSADYSFYWTGILVLIGMIIAAVGAGVLAVPLGAVIGKLLARVGTAES